MKTSNLLSAIIIASILTAMGVNQAYSQEKILLRENWAIQSSATVNGDGSLISDPGYRTDKWYPATVPSTVFGTLVENKVYPDPYFGTNILSTPGNIAGRRGEIPDDSPYKAAWWYRTSFSLPRDFKGRNTWLNFHSINYRANIWLNGHLLADTSSIEGAYRLYNFNITEFVKSKGNNCLALEIFPPKGTDLTITWVDWNPTPPDRGMGIWYDVSLYSTGPVEIRNTHVKTKLNLPSTDQAKLTVTAELVNASGKNVTGTLKGKIENIEFSSDVMLDPGEKKIVSFDPETYRQLEIANPRLWWPNNAGPQNLYDLTMSFEIKNKESDSEKVRFGIREITSWMNEFEGKHTRVFQVNGKNIVIRGGGYVQDMMLRPSNERSDADILYAKHMGLNALRMEAPRGDDYFFEKCDEEGIMLIVGWCCCSSWERWKNWTPHVADIAVESWKDQVIHLRNHPSVFNWLMGSDYFPPADIEKRYIEVLVEYDGTRPYQSSATQAESDIAGFTGLWMGPFPKVYAYFPPSYWYTKLEFNTEAGPSGEQIPPVETMRLMMPEKDLWPMSESWDIRLHKNFFPPAREALYSRYGKPEGLEEYSMKSQMLQYEAARAMFEAFAANKYRSSGIIYWMYNSAWPSLYWQLYDYFLAPNGSFYGTRKACEPVHIQYSYDDRSIRVVNGKYEDIRELRSTAKLYDFNLKQIMSKEVMVNILADESVKITGIEMPEADSGDVFFLKLDLSDNTGREISSNFYWLSGGGDERADFKALNGLGKVRLSFTSSPLKTENGRCSANVEIENTSETLAFFVNPKILKNRSKEMVLPVFWDDNYITLFPKEKRTIKVEFNLSDLDGENALLAVDGWNIIHAEAELN